MEINADFSKPAVVRPGDVDWVGSPLPGVERIILDRIGGEVARATSLVRYAAGSRFDAHDHALGEEYLVLEGIFSDQDGDHGPGTYVRNPPGTSHAPWSVEGCTIFVKLRQFQDGDDAQVVVDTGTAAWADFSSDDPSDGPCDGVDAIQLHQYGDELVRLLRLAPGARLPHGHFGGEEVLVLDGTLEDDTGVYPQGSWTRHQPGYRHYAWSADGCIIWIKTGHLHKPVLP